MAKFAKKKKGMSPISTASLPDIVFMLLFFFMVVTVLKSEDPLVKVSPPEASELTSIEKKHLVQYINIGPPASRDDAARLGSAPVIQFNDYIADESGVRAWVNESRKKLPPAEQSKMIVSLKVDKDTKMRLISDVKQELRKANALKILYNANERARTTSE